MAYVAYVLDYEGDTHVYIQIADILRRRVSGLAAGSPVPSEAEIQQEFGVARTTARRAVNLLREEGLLYTVQGEGSFVGPPAGAPRQKRKMPIYQQIAADVSGQIKAGELLPRRPIPGETALVKQYGVARETVRRAMALLREQGWIYTVAQRGSYVSPKESWPEE
ncbi:GntR family transcriptional regulator [Nonomuraea terrae]|uniref:GntR family transcriptional regulator n=1 Tax=Nonomuraea terrae TaxID=2530383 RepID=A0A4R4YST6_9ACTN|nr:GntR family transcriptional regulator [Nonomuraea terrae]